MSQKRKAAQRLRNRIKELRTVKASDLIANEQNWRAHPDEQKGAITAMLEEVGFVSALVARETDKGIELIDGHMRADVSGDEEVPVIIVDLDDNEVKQILATFDPVGDMALMDAGKMDLLLNDVLFEDNAHLKSLIAGIEDKVAKQDKKAKLKRKEENEKEYEHPDIGLQPHEHYDYLVVLCTSTHQWNVLCDRLGLEPETHPHRAKIGTSRAIYASQLLPAMKEPSDA